MPKSKYNDLDICVTDYRDGWIEKLFRRFLKSNFCPPPPIQIEKNQEGAKRHIRTETQTSVLVKSFLGNFYRHLAIFSAHTAHEGFFYIISIKVKWNKLFFDQSLYVFPFIFQGHVV